MDTINVPVAGIGPNILRVASKEVKILQSKEAETTYKCAAYYDCEWHDSGTPGN